MGPRRAATDIALSPAVSPNAKPIGLRSANKQSPRSRIGLLEAKYFRAIRGALPGGVFRRWFLRSGQGCFLVRVFGIVFISATFDGRFFLRGFLMGALSRGGIWRLGVLMWIAAVEAARSGSGGLKGMYWRHDALAVARCEVSCGRNGGSAAGASGGRTCLKTCLNRNTLKPGSCPLSNSIFSPFAAACIEECKMDRHCNGLKKCCLNPCGVTCQSPVGLELVEGLPEVPTNVRAERRKKRTVYIEWSASRGPGRTLYLIEERHHSGKVFKEYKLSEWRACSKPGRLAPA
ncbi:unnamed protein product [Acanthoscelides obtectus]|uniref:WAP domain-containing protein n=2 Tax=Acanthoscelides obtectus TaxID=200917 RepID=A0A9P0L531_ACAOB|nr:unnamed protein product [Acanthoscelides obtectus]CAK1674934.1 Anosmin-1 [Acanthoscelides obtectus]